MVHTNPAVRFWYGGKTIPDIESLADVEDADLSPVPLFRLGVAEESDSGDLGRRLYDHMDTLKRSPQDFRTWTEEDGYETFLQVLLDVAPPELRTRVQILQRLGTFRFRKADGPEQKRAKINAIFSEPDSEEDDFRAIQRLQARRLSAIWAPRSDSLLAHIIHQPAQVGRVLSERLNPAEARPLRLIGHLFEDVRSSALAPLVENKIVAYERKAEIHLVMAVQEILEQWDRDAAAVGGCANIDLTTALLLHELVEVVLQETDPELEPLDCHVVASTFERYLKGELLHVAVEDFFLNWPPLSQAEIKEQRERELAEQMEEISQFLGEHETPVDLDEDIENLPLDTGASTASSKGAKHNSQSGNRKKKTPKNRA